MVAYTDETVAQNDFNIFKMIYNIIPHVFASILSRSDFAIDVINLVKLG